MNCRVIFTLLAFAAGLAAQAAHGTTLLPTDDGFGYEFFPGTSFNAAPPFSNLLPVGDTTSGHDTKASLRFDLTGLTLAGAQSSTLDLRVVDGSAIGFGTPPTPATPITINLFALDPGAWNGAALTWGTTPAVVGSAYDSLVINGINQTVSFDVTELVKDWLDGSLPNNGLVLIADAPVGTSPNFVSAVFSSSESGIAPQLNVVPEPGTVALALCAVPALFWYGHRRKRRSK